MKNINISKKEKKKNIKNEIKKLEFKTNNDEINIKSKKFFLIEKNQTRNYNNNNNLSTKIRSTEKRDNPIKKYKQNLILINKHQNKEKNLKTKKNIIVPKSNSNDKKYHPKSRVSGSNFKYISNKSQKINNLNRVNGYSLSQKRGTFSNFSINKIIQITNPRSKSKSPKRNYSANPHYKNKDQKKLISSIEKNQLKQYQKLSKFYQKEKEKNSAYSIFSFPEIKKNDETNKENRQIPVEYFNNFLDTFCKEEKSLEFLIIPNFMENQKEINNKMRAIVVNWLIDVHDRFKLLPDTLFLGVVFFDRYLSRVNNIKKEKLQLIGVTSLLIACKYEEIFSPEIRDFVCILDRTYEREDIIEQENYMLKILKFEITFPTSLRYYEILRIEFGIEEKYFIYGDYLLTLSLIDSRFSKYPQAVIATTVCFFLKKLFYGINIKVFLGKYVKIKEDEIKSCLIDICFLLYNIEDSIYTAVNNKFNKISNEIKNLVFNK